MNRKILDELQRLCDEEDNILDAVAELQDRAPIVIPELIEGIEFVVDFINAEMGELPQCDKEEFPTFIKEMLG